MAIRETRSLEDRVRADEIAIQACFAKGNLLGTIERAQAVLKDLGVDMPKNPSQTKVLERSVAVFIRLLRRNMDELSELPKMKDPLILASMRMMMGTAPAVYFSAPDMMPLPALEQVRLSLRHGNAPSSGLAYVFPGLILCGSPRSTSVNFSTTQRS